MNTLFVFRWCIQVVLVFRWCSTRLHCRALIAHHHALRDNRKRNFPPTERPAALLSRLGALAATSPPPASLPLLPRQLSWATRFT